MALSPDPHGQAALMLCESLLLLLIEEEVIQKAKALEAIEGIVEVKREIAGQTESVVVSLTSIGLLRQIQMSLAAADRPSSIPA